MRGQEVIRTRWHSYQYPKGSQMWDSQPTQWDCNPPLQSGVVPGDCLVYTKGLRWQLEGHKMVISVQGATNHWDKFPPRLYRGESVTKNKGTELTEMPVCWERVSNNLWEGTSCPTYLLKGWGDDGWRRPTAHTYIWLCMHLHSCICQSLWQMVATEC